MININKMTNLDLENIKHDLDKFDDFWTYEILKKELEKEDTCYIVAKDDEEIVGFAGIWIAPYEIDIMNIVVRKDNRNQKIATKLMEELLEISKKTGKDEITLEVNEKNIPAIKLYKKFMFEKVGIRKKYYKDDNAIIMTRKLKVTK